MGKSADISISVVIPCFRVRSKILSVLARIGPEVSRIYVVDDACPEGTGVYVQEQNDDPRVRVLFNQVNQGVGGAVLSGYRQAADDGATVIVKLDGDDQMDSRFIPSLVSPILDGKADYAKGNRFFSPDNLNQMPTVRVLGNSALSFINKCVSGYWNTMDPTNGFTAIHVEVIKVLKTNRISKRYFFESDMLFRLGTIRAVVKEVPMPAIYDTEESNLSVGNALLTFPGKFAYRFCLRILYNYFIRDFNVCSLELLAGIAMVVFGSWFGISAWSRSADLGMATPTGTVMLAVLPIIIGFQLLLSAVSFDVAHVPTDPIHPSLALLPKRRKADEEVESGPDMERAAERETLRL